ncbi:MAG: hypothetical protein ACR2PY_09220 [Salinispira sp.]
MPIFVILWYGFFPAYNIVRYLELLPFWTAPEAVLFALSISLYFWMSGNVLMGLQLPLLQRALPQDKKTEFHIITGVGMLAAIFIHGGSKIIKGYFLSAVTWALLLSLMILFILSTYWISAPGLSWLHKLLAPKSTSDQHYDLLKSIHGIGFPAVLVLSYLHIREAGIIWLTDTLGQIFYVASFWFTMGICIIYVIRKLMLPRAHLKTVSISKDLILMDFVPSRPLRQIPYRAGQFAYLTPCSGPHKGEGHPFSFVSHNAYPQPDRQAQGAQPQDRHVISFAARQTGDFTHWLQSAEGQQFTIDAAYGNFAPSPRRRNCLIGTGSGMAPIIALLNEGLSPRDVVFLKGRKQDAELLNRLTAAESTGTSATGTNCHILETGSYINANFILQNLGTPRNFHYYLCTSPAVRENILSALRSLGVKRHRIHFENYSFGTVDKN